MFGFGKKKKIRHEFNDLDREISREIAHNKQMRQIERLRALRTGTDDKTKNSLRQQLDDMREFAQEMGYVKAEDSGNSSDAEMLGLLMQVLQGQKPQPIPQDIQNATKTDKKKPKQDVSSDIASKIPKPILLGIRSGAISKETAKKWADDQFEKTWKSLKGNKS